VEDIGIQVGPVGPGEGAEFGVDANVGEDGGIAQWREDPFKPQPVDSSGWPATHSRSFRNARTTKMLICTARRLLSTVAAMIAPCSVKASGAYLMWARLFKVTDCDLERRSPERSQSLARRAADSSVLIQRNCYGWTETP